MICFPNAKINIGLQITEKRPDGYHNINSVFYPIGIRDILEVLSGTADQQERINFQSSGIDIPGNFSDNLCVKAASLLMKDFPHLDKLRIHLHKIIPMGAGIGGGSADGAFTLKLINDKFKLKLDEAQLIDYASALGSDCPFFILNKPCHASGRGEILEPIEMDLKGYKILLINPGIHINTGWAFSKIDIRNNQFSLNKAIALPIGEWRQYIKNDFEKVVFSEFPAVETIKDMLYQNGAMYASMSGSGSSVYGIYEASSANFQPKIPSTYFYKWI